MTTQSFHGGNDFDPRHRSAHRNMGSATFHDRHTPYGYHDPPSRHGHDLRQEYATRMPFHASIQEPDDHLTAGGQARRRIAVACARCRRRKIKCSGDPGDGNGCQACRNAGPRQEECNFTRVGSKSLEIIPAGDSDTDARAYHLDSPFPGSSSGMLAHLTHHRPSLPVLQTRSAWPTDYDAEYEASPVESYTYATSSVPRNDSLAPYETRNYGTHAPFSAPVSSPLYDSNTYSFGSLQSPMSNNANPSRLPSVSADSVSALNMSSLHSSLPTNTATPLERRLPVPFTINYPQQPYMSQSLPEPRPIDPATANFRPYINGVHSRSAMPWSFDTSASRNNSVSGLASNYSTTSASQHQQCSTLPSTTSSMTDPVLGYQFQPPSAYSPESPPSTVASLAEPFPSTSTSSMLPPTHSTSLRYTSSSASLPTISASFDDPRPSSSRLPEIHAPVPVASLFSFSSETSDRSSSDATVTENNGRDSSSPPVGVTSHGSYAASRQYAQPHYSSSHDGLRRQSDYDQTRSDDGQGHHMSMRGLNGLY